MKTRKAIRTALSIVRRDRETREVIEGDRACWSFRPHYHSGDEQVHLLKGRARLRLRGSCRLIEQGETVIVPAGVVHRFEPVDGEGWSFVSQFVVPKQRDIVESNALGKRLATIMASRATLATDIDAMAAACDISAGYLARRFRREIGTSLHNFHVLLAIHKAKVMLQETDSLVAVALEAGFYDQAHLNREFVRTFGLTPGSYRSAWAATS